MERTMSVSVYYPTRRGLVLALGLAAAVTIVACDRSPTQPDRLTPINGRTLSIEGDTLSCEFGWTVQNGRYVCNDPG